jgi:hypothetical protein
MVQINSPSLNSDDLSNLIENASEYFRTIYNVTTLPGINKDSALESARENADLGLKYLAQFKNIRTSGYSGNVQYPQYSQYTEYSQGYPQYYRKY